MQASGLLFLGKTKPLAKKAADGQFAVTLLAIDKIAPLQAEAWQLIYTGQAAQEFWVKHGQSLKAGQPLQITAKRLRTHTTGRFGSPEIHAQAEHIELAPWAHEV